MKKAFPVLVTLFLATLLLFLPILVKPEFLLGRGNDLSEFFWPVIYFVKEQILKYHELPFWNNLFLSGTPLLPDPQAPIFYFPRIIFLFLPIDTAFIVSGFLHIFLGGIGIYLVANKGLNMDKLSATFAGAIYALTPRMAGFLEGGHVWSIAAWSWLPYVVLFAILLAKKPCFAKAAILAIFLSGLFCTHTTTFIWASAFLAPFFLIAALNFNKSVLRLQPYVFFAIAFILTLGLSAIMLLPELTWIPTTNRYLLAVNRQVYPIWTAKTEFIKALFTPWIFGIDFARGLDTEKWLALGTIPSILAFIGFIRLKRIYKILAAGAILFTFTFTSNNASPFYGPLMSQNWYVLGRVSSRIWFLAVFIVILLAGFGLQIISKNTKVRKLALPIFALTICELIITDWVRITKPIIPAVNQAPAGVYEFLAKDTDRFRVFCTTRCLSQKAAALYHLELIDGYSTLIQKNYNSHAWQMMGSYWNYYTLSVPPIGAYMLEKLQPDAVSLGVYNTKYVISPHELTDENFYQLTKIGDFIIYANEAYKPRSEAPITFYSPNRITINTTNHRKSSVTLAEVYSPGWFAYLNGKEKVAVQETPDALRLADIKPDTKFVDFKYEPDSFKYGYTITALTIAAGLTILILPKFKRVRNKTKLLFHRYF